MHATTERGVSAAIPSAISGIVDKYRGKPEMLMRMMLEIQAESNNSVSEEIASYVSRAVGIPKAKLYNVTSFYSMFSGEKRGRHIIRMCKSAPCHVKGADAVANAFLAELGIKKAGETSADGAFTFEFCECLGVCDASPAAIIGDTVYGNLSELSVKEIISTLRKGAEM